MHTPCYYFDLNKFNDRANQIKEQMPSVPLTYSIKANPFLLEELPDAIAHVEVCSPGELEICTSLKIAPERIIYSGVMKESTDVHAAISYGVDILTCESIQHAKLIEAEHTNVKVLLRLTSGNQFGMSLEDIKYIIANQKEEFPHLNILGIHFYSGTQKNGRKITKDLQKLEKALLSLESELSYKAQMVEYGPGLFVDYFTSTPLEAEAKVLEEAAPILLAFKEKYPLAIEMGRFLAAGTGEYYTSIMDLKSNNDTNYAILDGGIHHLNYFGQMMAMQVPNISYIKNGSEEESFHTCEDLKPGDDDAIPSGMKPYCLCGSLCTVADVIVREAVLPELSIGDTLKFGHCGAYSVTEAPALFLSRPMPAIYVKSSNGLQQLRDQFHAAKLNMRQ